MIINVREWKTEGYRSMSIHGAMRAVMDTLVPMGESVEIDGMIDVTYAKLPASTIASLVDKVTGKDETFSHEIVNGKLVIRRLEDVAREDVVDKRKPKWPFATMQVGDVVDIAYGQYGKARPQVYAHVFGKQYGMKFKTRRNGATFIIERIA